MLTDRIISNLTEKVVTKKNRETFRLCIQYSAPDRVSEFFHGEEKVCTTWASLLTRSERFFLVHHVISYDHMNSQFASKRTISDRKATLRTIWTNWRLETFSGLQVEEFKKYKTIIAVNWKSFQIAILLYHIVTTDLEGIFKILRILCISYGKEK